MSTNMSQFEHRWEAFFVRMDKFFKYSRESRKERKVLFDFSIPSKERQSKYEALCKLHGHKPLDFKSKKSSAE